MSDGDFAFALLPAGKWARCCTLVTSLLLVSPIAPPSRPGSTTSGCLEQRLLRGPLGCSVLEDPIEECRVCLSEDLRLGEHGDVSHCSTPTSPFCTALFGSEVEIVRAFDIKAKQQVTNLPVEVQNHAALQAAPCPVKPCPCAHGQLGPAKEQQGAPVDSSDNSLSFPSSLFSGLSLLSSTTTVSQPGMSLSFPPHGVKAMCGKRSKMEDAFSVHTNFFDLPMSPLEDGCNKLPARIAVQLEQTEVSPSSSVPLSPSTGALPSDQEGSYGASRYNSESSCDTLHFFGVYEGHGGDEASQHCAARLHHHLSQALSSLKINWASGHGHGQCSGPGCLDASSACGKSLDSTADAPAEDLLKSSCDSAHSALTEAEVEVEDSDASSDGSEAFNSRCDSGRSDGMSATVSDLLEEALRSSFLNTDAEFSADGNAAMVGSTAVVALVGKKKIWLANCGRSS